MFKMAIVKLTYTKSRDAAKKSVRYMQHRPGKDGARESRTLFNSDGQMTKREAYWMIDNAKKGSLFFRIVISPDPKREDTGRDLYIPQITEQTMLTLEERVGNNRPSDRPTKRSAGRPSGRLGVYNVFPICLYSL